MAQNRKYQSVTRRFGPPLAGLLLLAAVAGAGWCYLWQKGQIAQLGRSVKDRERQLDGLRIQNDKLRDHLAGMRNPDLLKRRIAELGLGLAQTVQGQVESLPEPPTAEMRKAEIGMRKEGSREDLPPIPHSAFPIPHSPTPSMVLNR